MATPNFSILLVNYNGLVHLEECLRSIYTQEYQDFEVVMVDNASRDESVAFTQQHFPLVKIVESPKNLGFAGGNNLGLGHCLGRYIFFLNNDTCLASDALGELNNQVRGHPDLGIFGCFLINYANRSLADSAGDCLYAAGPVFSFSHYPVSMFTEPRFITSACAGAAVYSRAVLDKIGFFDEDFFLNFEDVDLSFRAQHVGEKILFLPSVKVFHKGSATLGGKKSPLSTYYSERNFGLFILKNFPLSNLIAFIPSFLFIKVARFFSLLRHQGFFPYLKGNWSSILLFPKILRKRKAILDSTVLTSRQFDQLLRRNWLRERLAFRRGDYNIPL
jgi:GT2 family glycosyltransferase